MQEETALASGSQANENAPLLGGEPTKKPFYRARPLWLVPFAITASIVRGMTIASRVEVFTQLSCNRLHGHHSYNHTGILPLSFDVPPIQPHEVYAFLDPLSPSFPLASSPGSVLLSFPPQSLSTKPSSSGDTVDLSPSEGDNDEDEDEDEDDEEEDPRSLPSSRCVSDPAVQAGAARLQTIMTTTMGLLSALTTGWWGHFGERHGRTKVLTIATAGLFLTDLTFILVSTPSSPLSQHGHNLLLLAPIIEGLLGGWSTLHFAVQAYISDCTSSGSRAHIFSRFTGIMYLGFSVGPGIGGWLITHPLPFLVPKLPASHTQAGGGSEKTVNSVFWVAICLSVVNFLLVLFVFPESLDKEKRAQAMVAYHASGSGKGKKRASASAAGAELVAGDVPLEEEVGHKRSDVIIRFLSPLAIFLPVMVMDPTVGRKRKDWSLTLLAGALFGYMLSLGVYQLKYLYAEHTFGWGAEQLSYYISFMGGARAMFLLFLLPTVIAAFKPKPPLPGKKGKSKPTGRKLGGANNNNNSNSKSVSTLALPAPQTPSTTDGKKPKPTRAQLGHEIAFDLTLTRCSLIIDIISNTLVTLSPALTFTTHFSVNGSAGQPVSASSQALFVLATSLSSMGSGTVPAVQSLALCMMQVRALNAAEDPSLPPSSNEDPDSTHIPGGTGALFGALAVLQSVGQMILGPMIFGLVYSGTVASFPRAIFALAAGVLVGALVLIMLVRNPVREHAGKKGTGAGKKRRPRDGDEERGRSRVSKDLRGGAVRFGGEESGDEDEMRIEGYGSVSSAGGAGPFGQVDGRAQ